MKNKRTISKQKRRAELVSGENEGVQNDEPRSRGRGLTRAERKVEYSNYRKRKKMVLEAEARNLQHLVLFLASDGNNQSKQKVFYNMIENSAILYACEIGPLIGRKDVIIRRDEDTDQKMRSQVGVCKIANLQLFIEKLKENGIEMLPESNESIIYFKLKKKYEQSEIDRMLKGYKKEGEAINAVIWASTLYPKIAQKIRILREIVYYRVVKMRPQEREFFRDDLMWAVNGASDFYMKMVHGSCDEALCAKEMMIRLDVLMDRIGFLQQLGIWDMSTVARIGYGAADIKKMIRRDIINKQAKEKNNKESV